MGKQGDFMIKSWEDIRKGGGLAPIDEIERFLGEEVNTVLTHQEVFDRIMGYFRSCTTQIVNEDSGQLETTWTSAPTKAGLAASLGISTETLIDYVAGVDSKGRPFSDNPHHRRRVANEDFDLLRRAYQVISNYYESKLSDNRNPAGLIYWLNNSKNVNWTNESKLNISAASRNEEPTQSRAEIAERYGYVQQIEEEPSLPSLEERYGLAREREEAKQNDTE